MNNIKYLDDLIILADNIAELHKLMDQIVHLSHR